MTKRNTGRYYALRCIQTRFREMGDTINAWEDELRYFGNNHDATACMLRWKQAPVHGQVYAFVGLKV